MKKNVFTILLYIFVFVFVSDLSASVLPTVRIGVITDGYLSRLSINTDVLEEEIIDLLSPEFNIIFPSAKRVSGRWSVKSIKDGVEKLLSDPDVDIIITAGLLASDYVLSKKYTAKPVFIPYDLIKAQAGFCFNRVINSDLHINKNVRKFSCVIDDQFQPDKNIRKPLCVIDDQSLPDKNSRKFSSVVDDQFQPDKYKLISKGNIIRCMVTSLENISESIKEFKKVINFNRLCIIEDSLFAKMNPYRKDRIKIITKQSGIEIIYKQVGFNAKSVSVKSNNKFDAVLIMPLLRFSEKEFTSFVLDLNKNKIPCFSVWGKDEVEKGVFLATSAGFSSKRHARKTALEIQQFLLDKKQLRPDTKKTVSKKLSVNMISAEMIGFRPNWRMITQADLVYKEKEKKDSISISDSVREALRNNLTIKTEKDNVRVNKQIEKQAKSVLLPRFDISAYGLNIDSDRASASFGMFAEQTAGIKAQVSQIIYDDLAITNYAVMKQLYKSAQMDLEIEEEDNNKVKLTHEMIDDIHFQEVSFRYGSRVDVFRNLNMTIKKESLTAIVGESGSGKTTLVSLLQSIYPLQGGSIRIGDMDLIHICKDSLRKLVSVVPQKIDLFSGTVIYNIAVGDYEPDMNKILAICRELNIIEFIEKLPDGFNTYIGGNLDTLSGGEKQRIAIARALYQDPEILILDEATSSLDSGSEQYIQNAIKHLVSRKKTVIVIAHRLSTIMRADQIILLKNGELLEQGTHKELFAKKGNYYKLWQQQFPMIEKLILN